MRDWTALLLFKSDPTLRSDFLILFSRFIQISLIICYHLFGIKSDNLLLESLTLCVSGWLLFLLFVGQYLNFALILQLLIIQRLYDIFQQVFLELAVCEQVAGNEMIGRHLDSFVTFQGLLCLVEGS